MTALLEFPQLFLQFCNEIVSILRASPVGFSSSSTGEKQDAINRPLFPGLMNHPEYYAYKDEPSYHLRHLSKEIAGLFYVGFFPAHIFSVFNVSSSYQGYDDPVRREKTIPGWQKIFLTPDFSPVSFAISGEGQETLTKYRKDD